MASKPKRVRGASFADLPDVFIALVALSADFNNRLALRAADKRLKALSTPVLIPPPSSKTSVEDLFPRYARFRSERKQDFDEIHQLHELHEGANRGRAAIKKKIDEAEIAITSKTTNFHAWCALGPFHPYHSTMYANSPHPFKSNAQLERARVLPAKPTHILPKQH